MYTNTTILLVYHHYKLLHLSILFKHPVALIYYLFHTIHFRPNCKLLSGRKGTDGRAVAQRLDAGFPPRRPGFAYGQHVGFVVDKAALGQVSPANHSTDFSIIIITRG
jgi:hypothetical protein